MGQPSFEKLLVFGGFPVHFPIPACLPASSFLAWLFFGFYFRERVRVGERRRVEGGVGAGRERERERERERMNES